MYTVINRDHSHNNVTISVKFNNIGRTVLHKVTSEVPEGRVQD